LDLFENEKFQNIHLDLLSVDHHDETLTRQKKLVERMDFPRASHKYRKVDLAYLSSYEQILAENAPYNMIFAGNVLAELGNTAVNTLIGNITPLLAPRGLMISVESQSNAAKSQRVLIRRKAEESGLYTFYPCPPKLSCAGPDCWKWRTDEFECEDIIIGDIHVDTVKKQTAHWTIYSKDSNSIYDVLHKTDPNLEWGVAAPVKTETEDNGRIKYHYEFCTESGKKTGTYTLDLSQALWLQKEPVRRGSIVGIDKAGNIVNGWDIVSGFDKN
jgi:hypothetical protein